MDAELPDAPWESSGDMLYLPDDGDALTPNNTVLADFDPRFCVNTTWMGPLLAARLAELRNRLPEIIEKLEQLKEQPP